MSTTSEPADDVAQLRRALAALQNMRAKIEAMEHAKSEPIAIIGIGCRFPGGANTPESFWTLLRDGVNAVIEVPRERWAVAAYYDPDPNASGKTVSKHGGFIEAVDQFDPHFFGIAPREAVDMDPQQRIILEVAWEALEDAGQVPQRLAGSRVGVFVGIGLNDYWHIQVPDQSFDPGAITNYTISGNALCITANRLSYLLDFRGPSLTVDTACSSSLVAVHLACQSLRNGDAVLALAGGVNLILSPANTIGVNKFLAPDGKCKFGDARADGYVRGEGAGVIVLKPLSKALADGDRIYAVIRGSYVNQDGHSSGLTVPNGVAQQELLREAVLRAKVSPSTIGYVEAHGTGTSLGDPIEAGALGAVFGDGREEDHPLLIGSVKTNIGHLEAGAGIAGLIKVALALIYRAVPPSLHFETPNPLIQTHDLKLQVAQSLTPWPEEGGTLLAGVSSFGFGGTNAHAILEAAPVHGQVPATGERPAHLLTLSAKDPKALMTLAQRFADYLSSPAANSLPDIGFSSNTGRTHFAHRLAVVAESVSEMREKLAAVADGQRPAGVFENQVQRFDQPKIAFLFTGQGSQYAGMGRFLYETQPTFRAVLDRCDDLLRPYLNHSLLSVLYPEPGMTSPIDETAYTQPALFALEYALAELWRSWGIKPGVVIGHSVGEYVAACVAGVFSLEDGLRLVAERGRLMQALPTGGEMAAVYAGEDRVLAAVAPYQSSISIAAINAPDTVVISGKGADIQAVVDELRGEGIKIQRLPVSHAFHSPLMEPMLSDFEQVARSVGFSAPHTPMVSNLTGELLGLDEVPDAGVWRRHIRETVRFSRGMETLRAQGYEVFLEIGPDPILLALGRRCRPDNAGTWLPSLREGKNDWEQMLRSLANLYTLGVDVDWAGFDGDYHRQRTNIPHYPFQRERYWVTSGKTLTAPKREAKRAKSCHPLLGERLRSPVIKNVVFESSLGAGSLPFLDDHRAYGMVVVPAAAFVEIALAAAMKVLGPGRHLLENVVIQEALTLVEGEDRTVQVVMEPQADSGANFQIYSSASEDVLGGDPEAGNPMDSWHLHASGTILCGPSEAGVIAPSQISLFSTELLGAARERCVEEIPVQRFYEMLDDLGMQYGDSFRGITSLWRGTAEAISRLRLPNHMSAEAGSYHIHPALLDAALQTLGATFLPIQQRDASVSLYLPIGLERFLLYHPPGTNLWANAKIRRSENGAGEALVGDVRLFDEHGLLVAEAVGVQLKRTSSEGLAAAVRRAQAASTSDWLYEVRWQSQALAEKEPGRPPNRSEKWLILADQGGVGEKLASSLGARGEKCVLAFPGETMGIAPDGHWRFDMMNPEHLERLLNEGLVADGDSWRGLVYLGALDDGQQGNSSREPSNIPRNYGCAGALHLIQALIRFEKAVRPPLWLVTSGAQRIVPGPVPVAVTQAPIWGLRRAGVLENPDLEAILVDLDPLANDSDNAEVLLAELLSRSGEDQIAFREGKRYVARLSPCRTEKTVTPRQSESRPIRLEISQRGVLDDLALRPAVRRQPSPGEVEIRVRATGLNFRDVLNALGMYPGDLKSLGIECAGEIVAVGDGVSDLRVGQEVVAIARDSFGTYVTTRADNVVPKPANLSFEEAATIPVAFLTANYGLHHLAGLMAGERVLIHSAAGGVGLAAVQLAQRAGAEVFATAGSEAKRDYLRSLGVKHVMDSRSLDFADEIMTLTEGQGVDVVLNSLAGEFIPKSLSVLKPNGRFLEIGKREIWSSEEVARFRPQASYFAYDLGERLDSEPGRLTAELQALMAEVVGGNLKPLPIRVFPLEEVGEAFRFMAQAKHIGKIVVSQKDSTPSARKPFAIRADATYLISGGLGGLGLFLAQWLADKGARHLVLLGRSKPSPEAQALVTALGEKGVQVKVAQADVAKEEDLRRVLLETKETMPEVRGIIHAAGTLDDGVLIQQDWSRFEKVMAPKVTGGWLLHQLSQELPLDFFVLFSSAASVLGSPGQGNYAAANAFLDALAHYRHSLGLPALSINWGRWGTSGMAAALSQRDQHRWASQGVKVIPLDHGLEVLGHLIGQDYAQVMVLPIDWSQYLGRFPTGRTPVFLSEVAREAQHLNHAGGSGPGVDLMRELSETPPNRRKHVLQTRIRDQAIRVLGLGPSLPLDPRQPLNELGLDSLMAVELRNALAASARRALPTTLLFDYPTIEALAHFLAKELLTDNSANSEIQPEKARSPEAEKDRNLAVSEIARLSDDEAAALLLQELKELKRDRD